MTIGSKRYDKKVSPYFWVGQESHTGASRLKEKVLGKNKHYDEKMES